MKTEYNFSKVARGKFYDKNAQFHVQVYIDSELVEKYKYRVKKIVKESIWQKENQKAIDS